MMTGQGIKLTWLWSLIFISLSLAAKEEGLPLYFWQDPKIVNFGDHLSLKLVERIVKGPVRIYKKDPNKPEKKLLAIGSLLYFARDDDILWGTGCNFKQKNKSDYQFKHLDVRAVRGPLTRQFLQDKFNIKCPDIYGDPALLVPYLFPEFKKKKKPAYDYIIIPHYSEIHLFPKSKYENVVYPTEPWDQVINKILNSKFVISGALHGIIIAEAYGIPARYLRVSDYEPLFKYQDYYLGTNRPNFNYATSVEEALRMGGEAPFECNLEKLYGAFPFDYWPNVEFKKPDFSNKIAIQDLESLNQGFVLETIKIDLVEFPNAFNPSIIRWNNTLLLSFRIRDPLTNEVTSKIGLTCLDNNLKPIGKPQILEINSAYPVKPNTAQDPRLIEVAGQLYIVYNEMMTEVVPGLRRMFVGELEFNAGAFQLKKTEPLLYYEDVNSLVNEKNWVPFNYEGNLLLAYSLIPHKIMLPLLDGSSSCETFATSRACVHWNWGVLRGGTTALQVDGEYLAFFHSCKTITSVQSEGKKIPHYFMGAYTFSSSPPFNMTKMSAQPIFGSNFYSGPAYKTWKPLRVVFPCGYVFDEKYIWIAYGRQDHEIWIAKIDKAGLMKSLVPVNSME